MFAVDDEVTINIPDCGGGQSGLACLGGVTSGTAILSDDALSDVGTFTTKVWGCDDLYSGPMASLAPPDLSVLQERYQPAYILPAHDTDASAVQGLTTFLRNIDFNDNNGKVLWDQALAARNLPASTSDFWTAMVVSAWQADEPEDADPDAEDQSGLGITKGINTHGEGSTTAIPQLGATYTGICAVFGAVFGETAFAAKEKYTVAHEIGHTLGLPHNPVGPDDPPMGLMDPRGDGHELPFIAENLKRLREYAGP